MPSATKGSILISVLLLSGTAFADSKTPEVKAATPPVQNGVSSAPSAQAPSAKPALSAGKDALPHEAAAMKPATLPATKPVAKKEAHSMAKTSSKHVVSTTKLGSGASVKSEKDVTTTSTSTTKTESANPLASSKPASSAAVAPIAAPKVEAANAEGATAKTPVTPKH